MPRDEDNWPSNIPGFQTFQELQAVGLRHPDVADDATWLKCRERIEERLCRVIGIDHELSTTKQKRERIPRRVIIVALVERAGFRVDSVSGWNVLLRPVARARRRRRSESQSEMEPVNAVVNLGLRAVVALEARLPLRRRRGISLVLRATRS